MHMQTVRDLSLAVIVMVVGFSSPILVAKFLGVFPVPLELGGPNTAKTGAPAPRPIVASAQRPSETGPVVAGKGKALYTLNCAPCHGPSGEGRAEFNAPALAGQEAWYLTRQLFNFKNGTRGAHPEDLQGMQMAPILRLLPDDQLVREVAQYIAGMPPFNTPATLQADADKGKALFVGTCLPCHGERAQGQQVTKAPRLAGQADWYLVRQITKFRQGIRGGQAEDLQGMQMAAIAKTLIDEQATNDLAAYINGLNRDAPVVVAQKTAQSTPSGLAKGKALYTLNCAPCHGSSGEGRADFNAPALAGQEAWYLTRQLHNFKNGTRGTHPEDLQGMQMAPILRLLADDRAIDDVVAYVAKMDPFAIPATLQADADKGKALFVGTCLPCHGERAQGQQVTKAPRLAGQADWYLVRQITKFRQGIRGGQAEDLQGMQMAAIAKTLIDEQATNDLAAYINGLR